MFSLKLLKFLIKFIFLELILSEHRYFETDEKEDANFPVFLEKISKKCGRKKIEFEGNFNFFEINSETLKGKFVSLEVEGDKIKRVPFSQPSSFLQKKKKIIGKKEKVFEVEIKSHNHFEKVENLSRFPRKSQEKSDEFPENLEKISEKSAYFPESSLSEARVFMSYSWEEKGWTQLKVQSLKSSPFSRYAAGFLEGVVSWDLMHLFHELNTAPVIVHDKNARIWMIHSYYGKIFENFLEKSEQLEGKKVNFEKFSDQKSEFSEEFEECPNFQEYHSEIEEGYCQLLGIMDGANKMIEAHNAGKSLQKVQEKAEKMQEKKIEGIFGDFSEEEKKQIIQSFIQKKLKKSLKNQGNSEKVSEIDLEKIPLFTWLDMMAINSDGQLPELEDISGFLALTEKIGKSYIFGDVKVEGEEGTEFLELGRKTKKHEKQKQTKSGIRVERRSLGQIGRHSPSFSLLEEKEEKEGKRRETQEKSKKFEKNSKTENKGKSVKVRPYLGRCSGMVVLKKNKKTQKIENLLAGHTTWEGFREMVRVWKWYEFKTDNSDNLQKINKNSNIFGKKSKAETSFLQGKARLSLMRSNSNHFYQEYKKNTQKMRQKSGKSVRLSFSSYPGCVSSTDDWTLSNSKVLAFETTNNIEGRMRAHISVQESAPDFLRILTASKMGETGRDWVRTYTKCDKISGTYNSQWMIVDYNLAKKAQKNGEKELLPETFLVFETAPGDSAEDEGVMVEQDESSSLSSSGYFVSFNEPLFARTRLNLGGREEEGEGEGEVGRAAFMPALAQRVEDPSSLFSALQANSVKDCEALLGQSYSKCRGSAVAPLGFLGGGADTKVMDIHSVFGEGGEGAGEPLGTWAYSGPPLSSGGDVHNRDVYVSTNMHPLLKSRVPEWKFPVLFFGDQEVCEAELACQPEPSLSFLQDPLLKEGGEEGGGGEGARPGGHLEVPRRGALEDKGKCKQKCWAPQSPQIEEL